MKFRFCLGFLTVTIMGAASVFVNAEEAVLTEQTPSAQTARSRSIQKLIDKLMAGGRAGRLATQIGPRVNLEDQVPIRYFGLKPNRPYWEKKYCDVVLKTDESGNPAAPHCLVLVEMKKNGRDVIFTNLRFDLNGKLVSASAAKAQDDENGKPIKGALVYNPLETSKKETSEQARQALDFWLAGNYTKFLQPIPGNSSTSAAAKSEPTVQ